MFSPWIIGYGSSLLQIFDFSTNDRKWYSRGNDAGSWWIIDTTNKYVVSWWTRGNWQAYKALWLEKVHSRIKFSMTNTSIEGNRWWAVYTMPVFTPLSNTQRYSSYCLVQNWTMQLGIVVYGVETTKYVPITLWNDYYLDFVADNWTFISILYDSNMVEVDRISATNLTNKVVPYDGFSAWEHSSTWHFYKIKWYRKI